MKKTYDAVKMMRAIRQALSRRYAGNAALEEEDLEGVRQKYGLESPKSRAKKHTSAEIGRHGL